MMVVLKENTHTSEKYLKYTFSVFYQFGLDNFGVFVTVSLNYLLTFDLFRNHVSTKKAM